jgi:hypothetical protein
MYTSSSVGARVKGVPLGAAILAKNGELRKMGALRMGKAAE